MLDKYIPILYNKDTKDRRETENGKEKIKKEDEEIVDWFLDSFNFDLVDVSDEIKKSTIASKISHDNADFARKSTACV